MIIYHPYKDANHCTYRIISILHKCQKPVNINYLHLADFYHLFPSQLKIQISSRDRLCPCVDFLKGRTLAVMRGPVTFVTDVEDIADPTCRTPCEEVEPFHLLLVAEVTVSQGVFGVHIFYPFPILL